MKILFIYPVPPIKFGGYGFTVGFPIGIGSISSVLKKEGYKTSCLVLWSYNKESIIEKINAFKPDLIGISSFTNQMPLIEKLIKLVAAKWKIPIIVGGIHASLRPNEVINIPGILGCCIGEGEEPVLEFVKSIENNKDYYGIRNFWFNKGKSVLKNEVRPLINNLDLLPYPDRELLYDYIDFSKEVIEILGIRGCPYECSYCCSNSHAIRINGNDKNIRYRSVNNVLSEIKLLKERYNPKQIAFHDDTFTYNKSRLFEFCDKYSKEFQIPYSINTRPELIDNEIAVALKKSTCNEVKIGLETGSEFIRKKFLNRNMSNDQIINAAKILHLHNLPITTFNMIGFPEETSDTIEETIMLNRKIRPSKIGLSIFYPYPGTKMYDYCIKKGYITGDHVESYFADNSILRLGKISNKEIQYYYQEFRRLVFN